MDFIYEKLRAGTSVADSDSGSEVARKFNDNFQNVTTKFLEIDNTIQEFQQTAVGGVHYKGSVATVGDLPVDAVQGDLYEVVADNSEWCWNGEQWFEYGKASNLSPIASADINGAQFAITNNVLNIIGVESQLVQYNGEALNAVLDGIMSAIAWEDMDAPEV